MQYAKPRSLFLSRQSQDLKVLRDAGVVIYQPTPPEFQKFVHATKQPILAFMEEKLCSQLIDELEAAVKEAKK